MTWPYATYADFTAVHSLQGVSQAEVNSVWLPKGASVLDSKLGAFYSVPFSDNNRTARQLNVDFAFLEYLIVRTRRQDDSEELNNHLTGRIEALQKGMELMMTDSAAAIQPSGGREDAWSTNQDYNPVFDMRDPERQRVDPDRLDDLEDADRQP